MSQIQTELVDLASPAEPPPALSTIPPRLMLVQRSHQDSLAIPTAVHRLAATARRRRSPVAFGTVVRLGRHIAADDSAWLSTAGSYAVRIADPESWTRNDQRSDTSSNYLAAYPHLLMPRGRAGSSSEAAWLDEVVAAQLAAGANVLLSPGLWVPTGGTIVQEIRLAGRLRTRQEGTPLLLNLAMAREHVIVDADRAELLRDLVRAWSAGPDFDAVYLRFVLPAYSPSYTEPRRRGFQDGLADLVRRLAEAGVPLVLPNTGLTGWVMTALGASGFGTGTSWGQRVWLEPGGGPRGVGRYLEPSLLHTVPATVHANLAALRGYRPCGCTSCGQLWPQGHTRMPFAWNFELAGLHYLEHVADLTLRLPAGAAARVAAMAQVQQAQALGATWTGLTPDPLRGIRPTHLPIWGQLLS